jgi:hypothetical protein
MSFRELALTAEEKVYTFNLEGLVTMSKILSFPCLFLGNLSHTIYISLRLALESQSSDLLGKEMIEFLTWLQGPQD